MLIKASEFEDIRAGRVDTAFRRWVRPTVKAGGTLTSALGVLAIDDVVAMELESISDADAVRAGFGDADAVHAMLSKSRPGTVYRIRFHYAGDDPRAGLREDVADLDAVRDRLARLDKRGEWTDKFLKSVQNNPGVPAQVLADAVGMDKLAFKARVRQLKALGLTESLDVGYRLSPRGVALLAGHPGCDVTASGGSS